MQQTSVQKTKTIKILGGKRMFKKMKHLKNEKGLTLIELLAVIVILAIIAAIAIPAIGNIINNTRDKSVLSDVQSAIASAKIAKADGSCGAPTSSTTGSTTATTVTCGYGMFEFKSDKIAESTTPGVPDITVVFNETNGTVTATTKLKDALSGKKIPNAINDDTLKDKETTNYSGTSLVITEVDLNKILGGN